MPALAAGRTSLGGPGRGRSPEPTARDGRVAPGRHEEETEQFCLHRIAAGDTNIRARGNLPPGITGWAQVNGHRGETETRERMMRRLEYHLEYINNWSLWFDLRILFLTALRSWRDHNAY
jgi:hypothetical protein